MWVESADEAGRARTAPGPGTCVPEEAQLVPIRMVADGFGIPLSTLHYWERRGLVSPHRRRGQRFYGVNEIRRIALVHLWRETGMLTIDDITTVLNGHDATDWRNVVRDRILAIGGQLDRLQVAQTYLSHLMDCRHEPLEECPDFQRMVSSQVRTLDLGQEFRT